MNGDITRSTVRPKRHFIGVRSQQGRGQLDADWNEQADITGHRDRAGTEDVIGPRGGPWTGDGFQVGMMVVPRRLDAVAVPAAGQGFVVGDGATILASGDGGATWSRRQAPAGVTAALRAVAFPAAGRGFVVGDDATILATGDGGATWTSRAAPEELGVSAGRLYVGGVLCENERPVAVAGQPDLPGATLPGSGTHLFYLDVWQRHLTAVERPELREVALAVPTPPPAPRPSGR